MFATAYLNSMENTPYDVLSPSATEQVLDYLNRLMLFGRTASGIRYVGYAYEFDVREPDYLIFSCTQEGERREYLVPISNEADRSTLHIDDAREIMSRPQYPEADSAIFAPNIAWNDEVSAPIRAALADYVRQQIAHKDGYRLTYASYATTARA